jgi:hypothetical protein
VFVDSVKATETPEKDIPSLIWLVTKDLIYRLLPHSLYLSVKVGLVILGNNRALEDWEFYLGPRIVPICADKGTGEVIKSGAKVLNGIPTNDTELRRNGVSLEDMHKWLSGIRVHLYRSGVGLSRKEFSQSSFEIRDVVIGPLDFLSHA